MEKLTITSEAVEIIEKLKLVHGPLVFHQSGGCCDGSVPMCYPLDEFYINETDKLLGTVAYCPFYMSKDQFDYWKYAGVELSIAEGRSTSFSLESSLNVKFITNFHIMDKSQA